MMVRLLRWGTFLLLILVLVGAAWSYPRVRDRFFGPMLAAPAERVEVLPAIALPTPSLTLSAAQSTARPTLPPAQPTPTVPAVIIAPPSPTVSNSPTVSQTMTVSQSITVTVAAQDEATPTPPAIATTSLLPGPSQTDRPTPTARVTATNALATSAITTSAAVTATTTVTGATHGTAQPLGVTVQATGRAVVTASATVSISVGVAVVITPTPPTPTPPPGTPPEPGEKGDERPIVTSQTSAVPQASEVITVTAAPLDVTPIVVQPIVVATGTITPGSRAVTPVVVTTVQLTPAPLTTTLPAGPVTNAASPLYAGPDLNAQVVGQVAAGESVTIVALYTEGTWYLLANGVWLPGAVVDNAPLTLPLVFPTMTPVPSATPTVTFTPLPTATLEGTATPTPTATSLEAPVCDCSADTLDCLGNIFANRTQAQQCFEYCFRQTGRDIHLLDPNLNGVACENLPNTLPGTSLSVPLCDANYTGVCVPITSNDLNCDDIPATNFRRVGSDPHGLDRDNDGIACEQGE